MKSIILSISIVCVLAAVTTAQTPAAESDIVANIWKCCNPTGNFWGLNDQLAPHGVELGLGLTTVYQANAKGGLSTNEHNGRFIGRYDLGVSFDLEKLMGLEGTFFLHGWGGWPDMEGIDGDSVGSAWGTNALAIGNRGMDITEAFYETPLLDGLTVAVGKLDFTGIFDSSEYADDECCQFLNAALVDDPSIPFPAQGLGVVLNWNITEAWYLMAGVADAQADGRETGFQTTFHEEDYFFYAVETGVAVPNGNYRFGMWGDPQPKANSDAAGTYRDDLGVYTSCDWLVYEEDPAAADGQGLGVFARYGCAHSKTNDLTNFASLGLQYQGLFDGRNDDTFGLAYAHGTFSDGAKSTYPEDYESVVESYYNARITPWFIFSPNVQYVMNAGGSNAARDAIIIGFRTQMLF